MVAPIDQEQSELNIILDEQLNIAQGNDPLLSIENVYQLWWRWADFHIYIVSPVELQKRSPSDQLEQFSSPTIIPAELIPGTDELECVYPIYDYGFKLSASKGEDVYTTGMSMCKLYYTIEKMVSVLVERLTLAGIDLETEVQIAFDGYESAQRKAFESIINMTYNVVITNFDPGAWGERYLQNAKRLADRGYGYPPEAPRKNYLQSHSSVSGRVKRN